MRCKHCGGEINLSVGRCVSCGRGVDATSDIRILRDLGAIAEQYGLDPSQSKYDLPPDQSSESQTLEQRTSAQLVSTDLSDLKKPGIQLSTYYELLGDEYPDKELSAQDEAVEHEELPTEQEPTYEDGGEQADGEDEEDTLPDGRLPGKIQEYLDKLDTLTAPITEKLHQWYSAKMPQLNRAISNSKWERLALMGILAGIVVVVIAIISAIIASIPASISGEWRISEEGSSSILTVEFDDGVVTAQVYDESGDAHIYKRGTYETSRSNGRDLLTIVYEDGSLSHLYYDISGITGEFVNVDTGASDRYIRID